MSYSNFLIFPHQLFKNISLLHEFNTVFLIEEPLFFYSKERPLIFNKLKLLLHRASMKYYYDYLKKHNIHVDYIEYTDIIKKGDFYFLKNGSISYYNVVDHLLQKKIDKYTTKKKLDIEKIYDTPNFICKTEHLQEIKDKIFKNKDKVFHVSFYTYMRKKFKILMTSQGTFKGSKLSYDEENRLSLPKEHEKHIPDIHNHLGNDKKYVDDARHWVEKHFSNNYGNTDNIQHMAFSHNGAERMLSEFIKNRLKHFGDYQDAISTVSPFLYHSLLSHLINIGLLDPLECIERVIDTNIKINNVEGFVRQILGWREYTRYLYVYHYREMVSTNFMKAKNRLTNAWYDGTTGWKPIDDTIKQAFDYGYLHHIQRLMVMGNTMNLMKFNPHDVYKWFMEFAIDSYDWVMISNVYSMVLYADGGLTTTKPYIASDAYLLKMSGGRFKKDGIWDVDIHTLFYNYIATAPQITVKGKRMNYLDYNGRTKQMYMLWDRKSDKEKSEIRTKANKIIKKLSK
jgi:deoxyribodipyrimidine photolyase-related protein